MNRRNFLLRLTACTAGLSFAAEASGVATCRIIGIGGAGCNLVTAMRARWTLHPGDSAPDFLGIDLDVQSLQSIEVGNTRSLWPPIRTLRLAEFGAGGKVEAARAVYERHRALLVETIAGADRIILVAGLGGGTGSGITPLLARLARARGLPVAAVVTTPFGFESGRTTVAQEAVEQLHGATNILLTFSNETWVSHFSADTLLIDVIRDLDRHLVACIPGVVSALADHG